MKKLIVIIFLTVCSQSFATNYYFSELSGNDARSTAQAQSSSTPWKTISKLNSFFASLQPGDSVLFKRGETFYGSIVIGRSGSAGAPINIGAFGTGAEPVITGFVYVANWTLNGSNIWESTNAITTLSSCNILSIDGGNYAMGRLPKTGYWTIGSTNGNSITDNTNLNSLVTNWTGAQVVLRKYRWILDKYTISTASGNTINFTNSGDAVRSGWGYFIQNDPRACTQANEWSFNSSTKKISVYSVTEPKNVYAPTLEVAVDLNSKDYITFTNLNFKGYNTTAINTTSRSGIKIEYCKFSFIGVNGIYGYPNSGNLRVAFCDLRFINSRGIHAGSSSTARIIGNTIYKTGDIAGMGSNGDDSYTGIISNGDNALVSTNNIQYCGYVGIRWDGHGTIIENNFVNYTNYIKDDGGGIYCYPNQLGPVNQSFTTRIVRNNIVLNSIGAIAGGTASSNHSEGMGIYADGASPNIQFLNNTIAGAYLGLFLNNSHEVKADGNKIYDCVRGLYLIKYDAGIPIDNDTITNNTFIAKTGQYAAYFEPGGANMPASFRASGNCYARPIDDNLTIWRDASGTNYYNTLSQWKTYSGQDNNSVKAFKAITADSDMQHVINETAASKKIPLVGIWSDVKTGQPFASEINLDAFQSAILIKTGNPPLPTLINWIKSTADRKEFRWQSAEEDNLAFYSVESSADGGKTWSVIGTKKAVGPSTYIFRP